MSTDTSPTATVSAEHRRDSRYLIGAGLLIVLLGVAALFAPFLTGIGVSITVGVLLVIGGLTHVAHAFRARNWAGSLWQILLAIVYVVAGIALLVNPIFGLTTLTLLLIGYFALSGLVELVIGVKLRPDPQWGWFVASGLVSLLLAGLLWAGFPSNAAWAIGVLVAVHFLTTGLTLVAVGYLGRGGPAMGGDEAPGTSSGGN